MANHAETKRQLLQIAFESARYKLDIQLKHISKGKVFPFSLYVWSHLEEIKAIRNGRYSKDLQKIHDKRMQLIGFIEEREVK